MGVSARVYATTSLAAVSADDILRGIASREYFHYGHNRAEVEALRVKVRAESDDAAEFTTCRFFCPGCRRCTLSLSRVSDPAAVARLVTRASAEVAGGRAFVRERLEPLLARVVEVVEVEVTPVRTEVRGYCGPLSLAHEIVYHLTELGEGCFADEQHWHVVDDRWGVMPLGAVRP